MVFFLRSPLGVLELIKSRFIQQCQFHPAPPFEGRDDPAFPAPERQVLPFDVPLPSLQLPYQPAFGHLSVSQEPVMADLISQHGPEV